MFGLAAADRRRLDLVVSCLAVLEKINNIRSKKKILTVVKNTRCLLFSHDWRFLNNITVIKELASWYLLKVKTQRVRIFVAIRKSRVLRKRKHHFRLVRQFW